MLGSPLQCAAPIVFTAALLSIACAERRPNSESPPIQLGLAPSASATPAPSVANPASSSSALTSSPGSSAPNAAGSAGQPNPPTADAKPSASAAQSGAGQPSSTPDNALAVPPLLDSAGKPLPQTDERPRVDSASFKRRIELLVDAIVRDDPSLAQPAFFPVVAYEQVKAVAKPARDWQYRLVRAFERDIHEYHRALGPKPEQAHFVAIDVPEPSARWMKPGSEGNLLGYFRVLRSRLRVAKADGKAQTFEVTSMISWRGEWYVVHLNGFD